MCPRGLNQPWALHPPSTWTHLLSGPALWCALAHLHGPLLHLPGSGTQGSSRQSWSPVPCRGVLHSLSLLFWGAMGTLPRLGTVPLSSLWLGPGGQLGPGETCARPAPSVCPPGRVVSVCSKCWLLTAQARGLNAL